MLRRTSKRVKELHDRAVSQIHQRHVQLTEPSPGPLPPPEHLQLQSYHHCNTSAGESERRLLRISGLSGPFLGGCCNGSAISPEEEEKFLQGPPRETQEEWHKQPAFMHRYRSITIFHSPSTSNGRCPRDYIFGMGASKQRAQKNEKM